MKAESMPNARNGFTLLEMMVAVAILAVMMLIFGVVISQTQETLTAAYDLILVEREAAAVCGILERDLRAITRGGYLRVVGGDRLAFTITGPHESMLARDDGTLTTSGVNTLSDNTKAWDLDTWVGGQVRINDAVHSGTLSGVTTNTGTDSDSGISWFTNQWEGSVIKVTSGQGIGTIRQVVANNNARTFTVSPPWWQDGSPGPTEPTDGDSYGLFFPPYPIVDSSGQQITVSPDWMATLPGGLSYTAYFASNSALVDYGRITSGENQNILWRRLKLLVPEAASNHDHDDVLAVSLQSVNDATYTAFCSTDPTFNLPPTQLSDWFDYLVKNCSDLQVAVYDKATSSWVGDWSSQGKTLDQWPTAVRVTFVLRGKKYELITNIN